MKTAWRLAVAVLLACLLSSCVSHQLGDEWFVRQRIPIEIQSGKPITIIIRATSPGGLSEVGIRCSTEVWTTLTNNTQDISIRLISSRWKGVTISRVPLGYDPQSGINSLHDLFYLRGNYQMFMKATVQIAFPNAPTGVTHAEILICRTPEESL